MALGQDSVNMAVFCDFENVALGVRDAKYEKFDIKPVLERLLLKGSIVVKKAYCDWERYKGFKAAMHEASFELIEIPHVRQSGKNSADIRLVVDALDLCYTKSHVDTFVIISGDSDFSPLVSKLRENAKQVIGVGVKRSTSDLLIANCDEFIFYDDLIRDTRSSVERPDAPPADDADKKSADNDRNQKDDLETRRSRAIELAVNTYDALVAERGDSGKMWASALKDAIKRRRPDFNESYYGFRAFGNLLEAAQKRGLLEVGRDEKSGTYVFRKAALDDSEVDAAPTGKTVSKRQRHESKHDVPAARHTPAHAAARTVAESHTVASAPGGGGATSSDEVASGAMDATATNAAVAATQKSARKTARKSPRKQSANLQGGEGAVEAADEPVNQANASGSGGDDEPPGATTGPTAAAADDAGSGAPAGAPRRKSAARRTTRAAKKTAQPSDSLEADS